MPLKTVIPPPPPKKMACTNEERLHIYPIFINNCYILTKKHGDIHLKSRPLFFKYFTSCLESLEISKFLIHFKIHIVRDKEVGLYSQI